MWWLAGKLCALRSFQRCATDFLDVHSEHTRECAPNFLRVHHDETHITAYQKLVHRQKNFHPQTKIFLSTDKNIFIHRWNRKNTATKIYATISLIFNMLFIEFTFRLKSHKIRSKMELTCIILCLVHTKTTKTLVCAALQAFVCVHLSSPVYASIAAPWQIPSDSLRLCSTNKKNSENRMQSKSFFYYAEVYPVLREPKNQEKTTFLGIIFFGFSWLCS